MKTIIKGSILAAFALAFVAGHAAAQKPRAEIGVQLVTLNLSNPDGSNNNSTNFGFGHGSASAAFYLNDMIALEPTVLYAYTKDEGASNATTALGLQLGLPIYLKRGWGKAGGIFVAPFIGMNRLSSGGASATQNHFGADVGTKIKVMDCLFWRGQVGVDMGLKNTTDGIPKYTDFNASFGLSVYLH